MTREPSAPPRPWRAHAAIAASAVAVLAVGSLTWATFPQPFVAAGRAAWHLGLLAALLGAFAGWGGLLCRALNIRGASWIATTALGAATTASVVGYLAPWWFPDALFAVPWMLAGWLLWLPHLLARRGTRSAPLAAEDGAAPTPPIARGAALLPWVGSLIFLQLPLAIALAPPLALDSLVYHLAIPHQAALYGRLVDMPWLQLSYFPLHAEMLYGLALSLDSGVLAQLLHLAAAAGTVAVAARLAGRWFGPAAAGWTALLLASIPMLNLIAGSAGNDWFVMLFVALALEQHERAAEEPTAGRLEAVFLGAAAATKYTALPALVLLLLPLRRLSARRLAAQAALVLAVALPWYGRNLVLRHNPVYPLLGPGGAASGLTDFRGGGTLAERLAAYLFEPQLVDESVGLLLPAAVMVAAFLLPGRRLARPELLLLLLIYVLPLVGSHPTARAFVPLLLVGAILGGGGVALLSAAPAARRAFGALALAVLPIHLLGIFVVWSYDGHRPLRAVAGIEDEPSYLRHSQPYYDAYRALALNAPPTARVLVVGESRAFYLDRPAVYSSIVDSQPLAAIAGSPPDAATAARRLLAAGIRFVVYYPPQLKVGRRPPGIPHHLDFYVPREVYQTIQQLLRDHARPVFHRGNAWIYELGGAATPNAATSPSPPGNSR